MRDVLTNLTQGVAGEVHRVTYDPNARPIQVPDVVTTRRPVKRVSIVEGFIAGAASDDPPVPFTFGLNDYELVPNPADPDDLSTIRFLPFGKKPMPDTDLRINYYPRTTAPAPITDLNVGSVVRKQGEELDRRIRRSTMHGWTSPTFAFAETAAGSSLDRVVALLGFKRFEQAARSAR